MLLLAAALFLAAADPAAAAGKLDPRLKQVQSADRNRRRALARRMGPELDQEVPSVRVFVRLKPGANKGQLKSLFPRAKFRSQNGDVLTAEIPVDLLSRFDEDPRIESVEASRKAEPEMDVVLSDDVLEGGYLGVLPGGKRELNGVQGAGVVVGFVDTGIDWKHKDFIVDAANTSRVHSIWDQVDPPGSGCSSPPDFGYGCEWSWEQINEEIDGTPAGVVRSSDTNGHGTHVAGIACGDGTATDEDEPAGTYMGVAQAAEIVMVKTSYYETDIIDGMNYIIKQAKDMGRRAVINLSLGGQTGPHDGTDSYESAINAIAASTPVVKSAGNDQKNRVHARLDFTATGSTTVAVDVVAGRLWIETEFWQAATEDYTASVGFYGCAEATYAVHGSWSEETICGGHYVYIANSTYTATNGAHQVYIYVDGPGTILYNTMNVAFSRTAGSGDPEKQFVDGFVNPSMAKFSSHHDGAMSISEPGNAENVITVGSYCAKYTWERDIGGSWFDSDCGYYDLGAVSSFSSLGPTRDGRVKPDLGAPSHQTAAALSSTMVGVDGNYVAKDGRHRLARGTSQAAPVVSGAIALKLGLNPALTASQIRDELTSHALVDDRVTVRPVPNYLFGHGKVLATPPLTGSPSMDASALVVSSISIRWSWTDSTSYNNTDNRIYRAGDAVALSASLPYTQTSWLQTSLQPNTSYTAFLVASNSIDSSTGAAVSTRTLAAPPVGREPSGITPTLVVANWLANGNPGDTEYLAQAASDEGFNSIVDESGWTQSLSANVPGLAINTTYYFRVKARNASGTETAYVVLPATPTGVATPSKLDPDGPWISSVTVHWGANSNPGVTEYMSECARNAARTIELVQTPWSTDLNHTFSEMTPNTTYYFGARARNLARIPSAAVDLDPIVTLAVAPMASSVTGVHESSFTASWLSGGNPEWTEYLVERATDTGFTKGTGDSGWVNALSHTFTGLSPNTTYYLRVQARNSKGIQTDTVSLPVTVTHAACPTSLEPSSVSSGSLVAAWGKGGNPDGTRFHFDSAYDPDFGVRVSSAILTATSLPMAGLTPDTSYYLRVRALDHGDLPTDWVTLPTTATLAQQPGSLPPTGVLDLQLTAHWDGGSNPASTRYYAQLTTDPSFLVDVASSGWVSALSHTFRSLAMSTTYYMRVKARNLAGTETLFTSLPSTVTLSVVATLPPEGINFPVVGPTQIDASWTLMSPDEAPLYVLASSADFSMIVASQTGYAGQEQASFYPLAPNASHYFKVKVSTACDLFFSETKTVLTHAQTPSTTAASALTVDSFQANWLVNGNPAYTRFLYEHALNSSFSAGLTSSPWITGSSHVFTGLSVNTSYYVRVRGRDQVGTETPVSSTGSVSTRAAPPGSSAPTDITATSVRARWTANGNPAGTQYLCERMEEHVVGDDSGWTTSLDHDFAGLVPNTTYYFFVRAKNHQDLYTTAPELPAALTLSALPSDLPASEVSPVSLRTNWGSNSNPPGTLYRVERSTLQDFSGDIIASGWIPETTYVFDSLPVNIRHFTRVKSKNSAGAESSYRELPPVATLASLPIQGATLPEDIHASSVTVNWGPGANPSGTAYYAEASTNPLFSSQVTNSGVDTILSFTFTGLAPNTTYYFRVCARNFDGVSTDPVALPTVMTKAAAPGAGAPPGIDLHSILWAWDPSGNPAETLYFAEEHDAPDFVGAANSGWISSSSHTFEGLSINTTYYFRVKAKNQEGIEGAWSETTALATLAAPPGALPPTGVASNALTVNWAEGENPPSTQYLAELDPDPAFGPGGLIASGWITGASAAFGGLTPNTEYFLRVRGRSHNGGETVIVTEGSTVTLANAPLSADPSFIFDVSVVANWRANGNPAGTEYLAQRARNDTFTLGVDDSPWTSETSYAFTGLTKSTQYYFRVKARNLGGTETLVTALPPVSTLSAVPVPTDVRFSAASQTGLTAQWRLPSPPDNRPVYQFSDRRDFSVVVATALGSYAQESASFGSLTPNTSYFFKVRLSTASDDYYSVPVVSATLPVAPGQPAKAGSGAASLSVSYAANGNGTGTFYLAQADTDPAFPSVDSSSQTANPQATLPGLSANTRYYVRVRAQHHGGLHSAYAPYIPLATLALPPVPTMPGILGVTFSSVTARWIALPAGSCSGYVLQASTASDFSGTLYSKSQSGDVSQLSVGDISPGTQVYLRVGSLNMDGEPNFLTLGSTVTLSAAVSQSTASATQVLQFNLSPQDPELVSIQITIPPSTLPAGTPVAVHTGVRFAMPPPRSDMAQLTPLGNGLGVDISAGGLQPSGPVAIVMVYDPAALPAAINPRSLVVARYDDAASRWVLLPTRVDTQNRTITTETTHFSIFAIFVSAAASALDAIKVSPVPWEPGSGSQFDAQAVTFSNMPAGTHIEIFTLLGESLWSGEDPGNHILTWGGTNSHGVRTGSGTYLAVIRGGGEKKVVRVVVVR